MPTLDPSQSMTQLAPAPSSAPTAAPTAPDPLANLRDIHLPTDVSAMPAFGWWLLAALILTLAISAACIYWKRHQAKRYRRQAQQLLKQIVATQKPPRQQLQQITELLKRIALHAYSDQSVAALSGSAWTDFLHQTAPDLSPPENVKELLGQGIYDTRDIDQTDVDQLVTFSEQWIRGHRALSIQFQPHTDTGREVSNAHI